MVTPFGWIIGRAIELNAELRRLYSQKAGDGSVYIKVADSAPENEMTNRLHTSLSQSSR